MSKEQIIEILEKHRDGWMKAGMADPVSALENVIKEVKESMPA